MPEIDLTNILNLAVKQHASDVHLKAGLPPILRVHGRLTPIKDHPRLTPSDVGECGSKLMNDNQKEVYKNNLQVDVAYSVPGLGRFRVNIFQQRGAMGVVLRVIPIVIQNFTELNLPKALNKLSQEMRGLILVTGITGSGKSTTLAAMLEYINTNRSCNVITVEDPIEFLHKDKRCIINQREIGVDTKSFSDALRGALRQDPDVILVGEMRDLETIEIALMAAETGHLVLSTLHTIDAMETINRIVSVFPPYQQKQIRIQLSGVIKGIVSQRLMPTQDGSSRVPAVELLIATARIRDCIIDKSKTKEIHDAISKGHTTYGMQTFDQSLMDLMNKGFITYDEALKQASNPDDFALMVQGITSTSDEAWSDFDGQQEEAAKEEAAEGGEGEDGPPGIDRF